MHVHSGWMVYIAILASEEVLKVFKFLIPRSHHISPTHFVASLAWLPAGNVVTLGLEWRGQYWMLRVLTRLDPYWKS